MGPMSIHRRSSLSKSGCGSPALVSCNMDCNSALIDSLYTLCRITITLATALVPTGSAQANPGGKTPPPSF